VCVCVCERERVCVCVCVYERVCVLRGQATGLWMIMSDTNVCVSVLA